MEPSTSANKMLTAHEVAKIARVHRNTVVQLAQNNELPGAMKVGRQWRFSREAIEAHFKITPEVTV